MRLTAAALLLCLLSLLQASRADAVEGPAFPSVAGWTVAAPPGDSMYSPDNLWDIIDGAAELFLGYGFLDLRVAEYTNSAGTDVRVELYRHSSAANAFGIYSQERNPTYHFVGIGTQGYLEDKVLNFLCGVYYVKISSHREGHEGREAMLSIGRRVAEHLHQEALWPPALALLPSEGRLPNTEAYIAENFLGYRFFRSSFTARYEGGCTLFVMDLGSPSGARAAARAYTKRLGGDQELKEGEITDLRDPRIGQVAMVLKGRRLCGVLGGGGGRPVHRYLEILVGGLPSGG